MCCFSHLCLDSWQTWINCFHLHLRTLYLQTIISPIWFLLSFSGHHPLTQPCCPVLRDPWTLRLCLSFWERSLCSIYRLSSSGFFILYFVLRLPSLRSSSIRALRPWSGSRDGLSDAHQGWFPLDVQRIGGFWIRFSTSRPRTWSFRLISTSVSFPVSQTFPHLLFCN